MSYGEYLEAWHARMAEKYKGKLPDFVEKTGRSGRVANLTNRVSTASRTWKEGESTSNLTPRANEKALARTQPKEPEEATATVIPLRRGA